MIIINLISENYKNKDIKIVIVIGFLPVTDIKENRIYKA